MDFKDIFRRIEARVGHMIRLGLFDETSYLLEKYGEKAPGLKSIGYKEAISYIKGECTKDMVKDKIIRDTKKYAKYQIKVFSKEGVTWEKDIDSILFKIDGFIKGYG
jgi:tRNA dimethylallyltransferase